MSRLTATHRSREILFPAAFNARKITLKVSCDQLANIIAPDVSSIKTITRQDQWNSDALDIYDWIGMASIKAQR